MIKFNEFKPGAVYKDESTMDFYLCLGTTSKGFMIMKDIEGEVFYLFTAESLENGVWHDLDSHLDFYFVEVKAK